MNVFVHKMLSHELRMRFRFKLRQVRSVVPSLSRYKSSMKPGWQLPPKQHRWGPEIPDSHYYWEHPIYTGFLLYLRGIRPYIEKLFRDTSQTTRHLVLNCFFLPCQQFFHYHNPDIRLKCVAFFSFYLTSHAIHMAHNRAYQDLMDLKQCRSLELCQELEEDGFWDTEEEDTEQRIENYLADKERLENLWKTALADASNTSSASEGFERLCCYIKQHPEKTTLPVPVTWRFEMIPYGTNNPHTKTFPIPKHEQPHRAFAFNLTYNNLASDWGDYINRLDNKQALLRPSRILFTDVYIPPTK